VASFEIAGRDLGVDADRRGDVVRRVGQSYREAMRDLAGMTALDVWYARLDLAGLIGMVGTEVGRQVVKSVERRAAKAQRKDRYRALDRLTEMVDGDRRFVHDPPLIVRGDELFDDVSRQEVDETLRRVLVDYRDTLPYKSRRLIEQYSYVDIARKVVGVGSVGSRAWVVLLKGRDEADPLILQAKQAEASVLEPYTEPSAFSCQGERVVAGQSLMQAASDAFLGWNAVTGRDGVVRDYYLRQLWDWKASPAVESMSPVVLDAYARICGSTLARSHARTGDRIAIGAYLGKSDRFDRSMATFAVAYADQNDRDHAALLAAIADGRVAAEADV